MKEKNILIVGAGLIGSRRAIITRKHSKKIKIFIYDKDFKKATNLAREVNGICLNSLEEGLKNKSVEIVIVSVINKFVKDICVKALKAGKHVLCEKPFGINYKEATEIYNVAKKYKRKVKCGFNHRYHPGILYAHKLCESGKIGKLLYIRGTYGHGGRKNYNKEWRAKKSLSGGGELLDQGSHLIDLSLWFFNFEKIIRVDGIKKKMFWNMEVDDNAFLLLETKSGKVAQIHASWTQWKNLFRFEIFGTKGSIEINGLGKSYGIETVILYERIKPGEKPKVTIKQFNEEDKSWEKEWKDFLSSIKNNKKIMSDEYESTEVMKVISMV